MTTEIHHHQPFGCYTLGDQWRNWRGAGGAAGPPGRSFQSFWAPCHHIVNFIKWSLIDIAARQHVVLMIFGTLNKKHSFFGKVQENKPSFFQFGTSQPDIVEKFCIKHPCRSVLTGALLCIHGAPRMHSRALQVATTLIEGLCACTRGPLQKCWWTCLKITTS